MDLSTITIDDFKNRFYRDFQYANQLDNEEQRPPDYANFVQDIDITNAFNDAQAVFNQALFADNTVLRTGYLLLSAHFLVLNLRASISGLNGSGGFPVASRAVGSVSEAYQIPTAYMNDPNLAIYTSTAYGIRYLNIVFPLLVGNIIAICGGTNP